MNSQSYEPRTVPVGPRIMGRILDAAGEPVDGDGPLAAERANALNLDVLHDRQPSEPHEILETGIKALDLLLPTPRGGVIRWTAPWMVGAMVLQLELIRSVKVARGGRSVMVSVEGRPRELHDLQLTLREAGVQDATVTILIPAEAPRATRRAALTTALTITEQIIEEEGRDVLLIVDHRALDADTTELIRRPRRAGNAVVTTLVTALAQDESGEGRALPEVDADVRIVFDEDLARRGMYPAVHPLLSNSRLLHSDRIDREHRELAEQARELLREARAAGEVPETETPPLNGHGGPERARRLERFLTQPFFVAQIQHSIPGEYVSLRQTLDSVRALIEGAYDALPEEALTYIGSIEQASESTAGRRVV